MRADQIAQEIADLDRQIVDLQKRRAHLVAQLDEPVPSPQEAAAAWLAEVDPPSAAEARPLSELPTVVYPDGYRYERVLVPSATIPREGYFVGLRKEPEPEAHLIRLGNGALCGRRGDCMPGYWWVALWSEMEDQVELCANCASQIPR